MAKNLFASLALIPAILILSACQPEGSATASNKVSAADNVEVSVDAVNYMHDWDVEYKLTDLKTNQPVAGAIVGLFEGPGGKNCCIALPKVWHSGMKFKVSWIEGGKDFIKPDHYAKVLEIPRYSAPGDLYVLFYPNQEVELIASPVEPGHANWAGKVKTDPFTACVKRLSEKECRKHLPKYRRGSPDAVAADMREACQEDRIIKSSSEELNRKACEEMQKECSEEWAVTDKAMCSPSYKEQ